MREAIVEQKGKSQGDDPDDEAQKQIWKDIFFGVRDKREAGKVSYPLRVLLYTGVLLFICQEGRAIGVRFSLRGKKERGIIEQGRDKGGRREDETDQGTDEGRADAAV